MASYVSLNVVEPQTFQNKRKETMGGVGILIWKMLRKRRSVYALFEATPLFHRDDWRQHFLLSFTLFQIKRVHEYFMCDGLFWSRRLSFVKEDPRGRRTQFDGGSGSVSGLDHPPVKTKHVCVALLAPRNKRLWRKNDFSLPFYRENKNILVAAVEPDCLSSTPLTRYKQF